MDLSEKEIQENIQRLKAKFGESRAGGKGSERLKQKAVSKSNTADDKTVRAAIKKLGTHPLQVDEVNMFKDDGSILHFTAPEVSFNYQEHVLTVGGEGQTKSAKDLLPDILQQLGPRQMHLLQQLIKESKTKQAQQAPELVAADFQAAAKTD